MTLLYMSNGTEAVRIDNLVRNEQGSTLLKKTLQVDRGETLVDIAAYCLMPNHFHLLLREKEEGGVSRFMQKMTTAYTMYFNKRYDRTGALLQGKFKSQHAKDDRYLRYLIAYIHLNPIQLFETRWKEVGIKNKKGAEEFLDKYKYSSFLDFCKKDRDESVLVNPDAIPSYFDTPADFKESMTGWLTYKNEQGSTLLK